MKMKTGSNRKQMKGGTTTMKPIPVMLSLCLMLAPVAVAESSPVDDFFAGLSQARDGLIGMAGDAAQSVTQWADESGVSKWLGSTVDSVSAWAKESGVTEWAQSALNDAAVWADSTGMTQWAQDIEAQMKTMMEENGPAVEAWLKEAGEEVNRAWKVLSNADQHTVKEVREALQTLAGALTPSAK